MNIFSRVIPRRRDTVKTGLSLTQQHFKDSSDINWICAQYSIKDPRDLPPPSQAVYADVSEVPDFASAYKTVQETIEAFGALPAAVRERFGNDPSNMVSWLMDPSNHAEACKLGLLEAAEAVVDGSQTAEAVTPAQPGPEATAEGSAR